MDEFLKRFSDYDNADLLAIISNPVRYQPEAVGAAQQLLDSRNLTDEQLENAKRIASEQAQKDQAEREKQKVIHDKVNRFGQSIADNINPMSANSSGDDRIAKMLSAFFIVLFVMEFLSGYRMLMALLTDENTVFDSSMLFYLLPMLYLLLTAILIWKRKSAGWFLGAALLTWSAASSVLGIAIAYANRDIPNYKMVGSYFPSITQYVLTFLFFAAMLSGFCTKRVRRIFNIPANQAATLIIVLSVLSGIALKYITTLS